MASSFRLINLDDPGNPDADFEEGALDLVWADGRPTEVSGPLEAVAQRVCKSSIEPRGSNRHEPRWGGVDAGVGDKQILESQLRAIGAAASRMVDDLAGLDRADAGRIGLVPAEMIAAVRDVGLVVDGTTATLRGTIVTGDGAEVLV